MQQCNCVKQEVYKILQCVLRDHCSLRGAFSRSNPDAIFRRFALWLRAPQILQPRWTTAKLSCKRFAWLLHWVANLRCLWTTDPWSTSAIALVLLIWLIWNLNTWCILRKNLGYTLDILGNVYNMHNII